MSRIFSFNSNPTEETYIGIKVKSYSLYLAAFIRCRGPPSQYLGCSWAVCLCLQAKTQWQHVYELRHILVYK